MVDRCPICKQFKSKTAEHVCGQAGPKKRLTPEQERQYNAEWQKTFRSRHPGYQERYKDSRRSERVRLKIETLVMYGGDPPVCACCNEGMLEFLTLDHTNGGGNEERRQGKHKGGAQQYRRLRIAGWPDGYRVLCWNCNAAIGMYGMCPHQQ